ncbi:MAG: chitobiase/beta-hexosaminidase C-terminal domain-containing protein [Clostridia bacterium]|nr:chitobiase/beta-hexosaminidase C-terminal domain-containing protein [Clostridia bacterium]
MKKCLRQITLVICAIVMLTCGINAYASIHGVIQGNSGSNTLYEPITLSKGDMVYFYLDSSECGTSQYYTWTSSDTSIVKCDESSSSDTAYYKRLEAVGKGTATITVYKRVYEYQTNTYSIVGMSFVKVTVTAPELISINPQYPEVYLNTGETLQNSIVGWYPADADIGTVVWSSSDSSIATVSEDGLITGVSEGTTTVYAKSGAVTASCKVTVQAPVLEKVSAPTPDIPSGSVNAGTLITLATQTQGASIYYTTDGTTPTISSEKYASPIAINDDIIIKAFAVKEGMESSSVGMFTYTVVKKELATVSISDAKGKAGDTVQLSLDISNNPGIAGMILKLSYDEGITLTDISAGDALENLTFTPPANVSKNPCTLLWDGIGEDNTNGTILTLTFKIEDTSLEGEYDVSVSYTAGDIYDGNTYDVDVNIDNGVITVCKYKTGDVNEDDAINAKDITLLRQHISGDYGVTINTDAADVNKDGVLNAKDITILRQYISGDYGIVFKESY